ncbi:uncharacterized protein [Primulina huaijiensis]|uniref:uncharacterized protein n=1 Tax=Primulina huaijiensis TaxID=1492673 RepID=UPI003CC7373C
MVQKQNPQLNHLPADGNDLRKPKTEATGFNSVSITSCIYHCCKRCAKKRQRRKYLPQEIFSKVLLHLPAQVLHDAVRPLYFADFCGFAFVEPSMEYKVVTSYGRLFSANIQCAVLTIGVDRIWRHIDIQHLSLTTRKALCSLPLTTGAFVHWIDKAVVLTLNMETETIHQFSHPPAGLIYGKFLPMENNLTYVCKANDFLWEVWEMNLETGVWNKSFSFDLGIQVSRYKDFFWFAEEFSSLWLVST